MHVFLPCSRSFASLYFPSIHRSVDQLATTDTVEELIKEYATYDTSVDAMSRIQEQIWRASDSLITKETVMGYIRRLPSEESVKRLIRAMGEVTVSGRRFQEDVDKEIQAQIDYLDKMRDDQQDITARLKMVMEGRSRELLFTDVTEEDKTLQNAADEIIATSEQADAALADANTRTSNAVSQFKADLSKRLEERRISQMKALEEKRLIEGESGGVSSDSSSMLSRPLLLDSLQQPTLLSHILRGEMKMGYKEALEASLSSVEQSVSNLPCITSLYDQVDSIGDGIQHALARTKEQVRTMKDELVQVHARLPILTKHLEMNKEHAIRAKKVYESLVRAETDISSDPAEVDKEIAKLFTEMEYMKRKAQSDAERLLKASSEEYTSGSRGRRDRRGGGGGDMIRSRSASPKRKVGMDTTKSIKQTNAGGKGGTGLLRGRTQKGYTGKDGEVKGVIQVRPRPKDIEDVIAEYEQVVREVAVNLPRLGARSEAIERQVKIAKEKIEESKPTTVAMTEEIDQSVVMAALLLKDAQRLLPRIHGWTTKQVCLCHHGLK